LVVPFVVPLVVPFVVPLVVPLVVPFVVPLVVPLLGVVTLLVQFMPQKVEFEKPEGFYPSMWYMIDFPVEFTIDLPMCLEYTTTVYSFDGLPYHV
jgi:hypothetical protein